MDPIYIERATTLWLTAADEGGVTLPEPIVEARQAHGAADHAVKALARPEEPVNVARLVDRGMAPADALAESDRRHALIVAWRRERAVLIQARSFKADALNRVVLEHLEDLVLAARPTVTEIVNEARPIVPILERFARRGYDAVEIVAKATAKELKAYQNVLALQARFDSIHKAWTGSYMTPARVNATGEPTQRPGTFGWHAREVDLVHYYWADPALVVNPRCAGTMLSRNGRPLPPSTSLLLLAVEDPEAGYRLAIFDELRQWARTAWDTRAAASRYRTPGVRAI